ncbi:ankyrin repeat protein [Reticulomyxa filosa]|uniref:Ankyrin repeat protein n=1 Tax=Reticulomyxa filosa TaxID=46433 RepID=X6NBH2_RETFI|nr:ankyrin repeat protein [Reticulomyxa filosa]|eukprot:ETO23346.1 ankyrin repeat protein [Reticulomyxa filosa]
MISWGMILIELDGFVDIVKFSTIDEATLVEIIEKMVDETLGMQTQYVDYMGDGQFVVITPVDVTITINELESQQILTEEDKQEYFLECKDVRLREIASQILNDLSLQESEFEFCAGVSIQDFAKSDSEWFELAKENLAEIKAYRELDRTRQQDADNEQPQQEKIDDIEQRLRMHAERLATKAKNRSVMQLVVNEEAASYMNYQDENGDSGLMIACTCRRDENKHLILGEDANEISVDTLAVVANMLKGGCNADLQNKEGMTALMFACITGEVSLVQTLLEYHCNLELTAPKFDSKTALHFAAYYGRTQVMELLISHKANLRAVTNSGDNALLLAVINGFTDTAQCLVNHGIDVNHQNEVECTCNYK